MLKNIDFSFVMQDWKKKDKCSQQSLNANSFCKDLLLLLLLQDYVNIPI